MANIYLSAFTDEYNRDVDTQINLCKEQGLAYFEPRFLGEKNIADLTALEAKELKVKLGDIKVSSIGSPLGKINLADDFEAHLEKAKRVFDTANILDTENIRMFSFYLHQGKSREECREEVLDKLGRMLQVAKTFGVTLCHENEGEIYGESPEQCLDILQAFNGELKAVFDMGNFVLGKYLPYDSVIHKMDPRAKILAMLMVLVSIFLPAGYLGYAVLAAVIVSTVLMAKLSLKFVWKSMKPMLFMLAFLMVINIFAVKTGYVLIAFGSFEIYSDAVFNTLYIAVRLMLMIMVTTCLTATTKPLDLTLGIEDLLKPFKKIGVPAHEIAMMISIALRFIPTLIEETERIMKAQASRGVDLQEGKLNEKIMAVLSLIVPLFVSAFQRAEDLANAMEARGYAPGQRRTRYKQLKFCFRDVVLLAGSLLLVVVIALLAFVL